MKICGLQKTTLLDFPGRVAATIFTGGCNFRCPFCHNSGLLGSDVYKRQVHYTQQELSAIIGSSRITISKTIKELCNEDFIRILNRNTQINAAAYNKVMQ